MAEIVNLRMARKAKARRDKAVDADRNRAAFGRTRSERERGAAEKRREEAHLDGHKRD